jgi:hypothetical protein
MARAYGSSAHLLMKRETAYGQAATGNYLRVPFNRCNLGSEQGLIDDPVLGQGRDPLAPLQDVINDEGDILVPVDPRYLGLWLTGLFSDPDTTDNLDGSWDHEFASGGDDLPSYTVEVGMPKVPAFFLHAGVKLNSIALEFTRSGPAAATLTHPWSSENERQRPAGRSGTGPDRACEELQMPSIEPPTSSSSANKDRAPRGIAASGSSRLARGQPSPKRGARSSFRGAQFFFRLSRTPFAPSFAWCAASFASPLARSVLPSASVRLSPVALPAASFNKPLALSVVPAKT